MAKGFFLFSKKGRFARRKDAKYIFFKDSRKTFVIPSPQDQIKISTKGKFVNNVLVTYNVDIVDKTGAHKSDKDFYYIFKFPKNNATKETIEKSLEKGGQLNNLIRKDVSKFNRRYKGRVSIKDNNFIKFKTDYKAPGSNDFWGRRAKLNKWF